MGKIYGRRFYDVDCNQKVQVRKVFSAMLLGLFVLINSLAFGAANVTSISIISGSNPSCSGSAVTFKATNSCATSGVTYQWKINGVNVIGQTASTFTTSTLTNGNIVTCTSSFTGPGGCSGSPTTSAGITMVINQPATVNAGSPNTVCQSSTPVAITLSGSSFGGGASSAAWSITSGGGTLSSTSQTSSPATVTYTPSANFSGTVTLTLTTNAPAGCSAASATRTITVNPKSTVDPGTTITVCESDPVNAITLTGATFGGGATSAAWSISSGGGTLSSTSQTASPGTITYTPISGYSGTVTLTLTTDATAGCTAASALRTITINPLPELSSASVASACEGSGALVTLNGLVPNTTASISYTVNGGSVQTASGVSSNGSGQGSFSTSVLSAVNNGQNIEITGITLSSSPACSKTFSEVSTLVVDQPAIVNAGADLNVCAGGAISLSGMIGGSATSATWSAVSGTFSDPSDLSSGYTPSISSGTVTLTLTTNDPAGACSAVSDQLVVTVNPRPVPVISPASAVCENQTGVVYSTQPGNASYQWTVSGGTVVSGGGANDNLVSVDWGAAGTGTITVNYSDANGCSAATSYSQAITINPYPTLSSASQAVAVCEGSPAEIDLIGLQSSVSYTVSYTINGGAVQTALVTSDASGAASFNTPALTALNNGQILQITGLTSGPAFGGCSQTFNIDVTLAVKSNPQLSSTLTPAAICSGTLFSYVPTSAAAGATFAWTRSSVAGISQGPSSGAGSISEALTNTTTAPLNVTYTVTTTAAGCTGNAETVTVSVSPSPSLISSLSPSAICSGLTFSYVPASATSGATFTWSRAAVAGINESSSSGSGSVSEVLSNTTSSSINVTYVYVVSANGCSGPSQNVTVQVNPLPVLSSSLSPAAICSGSTFSYVPSSATSGTTYAWSRPAVSGISQAASSGIGSVNEILTNTTTTQVVVKYIYTLTASGCSAPSQEVLITVKPRPTLSSTLTPPAICSGNTFSYNPSSVTAGATFSWTRAAVAGISQPASSGNGGVNEVLSNSTSSVINVTYVYTVSADGCSGSPQNVVVQVKPIPSLTSTLTPVSVCSGSVFSYTPTANVVGSTFSWTRAAVSGISQAAASGVGSVSEALTNTSTANINVVYAYTSTANGCSSNPQNVTVTIKPRPQLSSTLNPPAICSGSVFTYTASSLTAGTTFSWSKPAVAGITQPASSGTGNVSQLLTNSTASPVNVTYIYTSTAAGCAGSSQNVVVSVLPKPVVTNFAVPSATTVCAGSGSVVTVNSTSLGNGTYTVTYNLSDQNVATGNTATMVLSGGTGTFTTSVLTNTANNGSTIVTVTAITNSYGCTTPVTSGNTAGFLVDDMPVVTTEDTLEICSGMSVGKFVETDFTNSKITYIGFDNPNVSGESLTQQSPPNKKLNDILINNTTVNQYVTYNVSATSTNQGCNGPWKTVVVLVKPAPTMTSGTTASICSDGTFSIPLTSNMTATYSWIATDNSNTTGESLIAQSSNPLSNTITNNSAITQLVMYTVAGTSTLTGCTGPPQSVTVTVYPKPVLSSALTQSRCNNVSGTYTASSATPSVSFSWSRPLVTGISNPASSGNGNSVTETLNNTTAAPVLVTYTFTMSANGCSNTQNVSVTVNPTPTLASAVQQATVCHGNTAIINLTGLLPSVTSTLTYTINGGATQTVTGVVSSASGTASFSTSVLTGSNNGQLLQITGITTTSITPSCSQSLGIDATLSVTPLAYLSSDLTPSAICSGNTFSYTPTSATAGVTFSWTRSALTGISQAATSGSGGVNEILTNNTNSPVNVTYVYTTTNNGCSSPSQNVVVTVNPTCTPDLVADQQVCDGTPVSAVNFTGNVSGATYSWTNSNTAIGLAGSGTGNISSFNATCTGTTVSTITVTPTANGCTGTSRSFTITVRKPGSWIGVVSTDWFDPNNWDCGIVPNSTTDVFIPSTAPFMPTVDGLGAECHDLNVNSGASFCTATINNIDVYGNWVNNGTCTHNTGNVTFKGNCNVLGGSNNNFHHVTILGSLTSSTGNVGVAGNWTNNGTFNHNNGTITFNGTAQQIIGGSQSSTFKNFVANSAGITLMIPTTIEGVLTLTNGEILTNMTNILTLTNSATTSIGHQGSFVQGPMNYIVASSSANTVRNFPIGKDADWRPAVLTMTHSNVTPVTYTAEVINESADSLGYILPATVDRVSPVRWWQIDRQAVSNFTNAKVQLYYGANDGVIDPSFLTVVKTIGAGTEWFDIGGTGTAAGTGSITSTFFTTFSKFTLGNKLGGPNPLPVELVEFKAKPEKDKVQLSWITASEVNNDYFTIERTKDGQVFTEIQRVKGAGNSARLEKYETVDSEPFSGLSYYRLKQTDFDGQFKYSELQPVMMGKTTAGLLVYPNPSDGTGFTLSTGVEAGVQAIMKVHDPTGKLVYENVTATGHAGSIIIDLNEEERLATGLYWVTVQCGPDTYHCKMIVNH